ncbi:hypothetical protein ASPZODRAFT_78085 [Penicilliopsis zonata CBS 506.65]|uniref:Ribonuclease H1 N-terminal domain-containing protein n=1 Tax=Penicilliopsis zonata CBS 506.65 TaxID=1073090 RepID=A0A1L9S4C0_9EURO|nr:hypothetical protein ASPZODRAFT_78085 [Penicilliopsis zonata CBS 506.65]OJJ41996.1 hypothetical protein ASPZODRAFT_78085 [Penicilliopsis zonata CBS 506.65]
MKSKAQKNKNKSKNEYYAVYKGRVDELTIFSSWGDAHPRVTECDADHGAFPTLEEARDSMKRRGIIGPKEVFKEGAGETAPLPGNQAFYAVAYGRNPGIYEDYHKEAGAESKVNVFPGSCHKAFRTRAQAEAFIEDWKDTYAEIWRREIRKALDQGLRPENLKFQVEKVLHSQESSELSDQFSILSVKKE